VPVDAKDLFIPRGYRESVVDALLRWGRRQLPAVATPDDGITRRYLLTGLLICRCGV
jgi:hypothetical protein